MSSLKVLPLAVADKEFDVVIILNDDQRRDEWKRYLPYAEAIQSELVTAGFKVKVKVPQINSGWEELYYTQRKGTDPVIVRLGEREITTGNYDIQEPLGNRRRIKRDEILKTVQTLKLPSVV